LIDLIPRNADGTLIGPKSDQDCMKRLIKWVPLSPVINPHGPWPSYNDMLSFMKEQLGTTPHSIRRLAIQTLERRGFTSTQISSLTNHYDKVMGMNAYRQRLPVDPQARMSLLVSNSLLEALQSSLGATPMNPM
jgi:hypothetical protein